jgi:hypothetical protein
LYLTDATYSTTRNLHLLDSLLNPLENHCNYPVSLLR